MQDCDDGAAAQAAVKRLGHKAVRVHPVGGASFTHWKGNRRFQEILKTEWFRCSYGSVTVLWAGNDLTGLYAAAPDELEAAVSAMVAWCRDWDVPLRLFDVVGGMYLV